MVGRHPREGLTIKLDLAFEYGPPFRRVAQRNAEDRIGLGDAGDLLKRFASQTPADLCERGPLSIRQTDARLQVRLQNPVLCGEVLWWNREGICAACRVKKSASLLTA